MKNPGTMNRREFLKAGAALGGGLVLSFFLPVGRAEAVASAGETFAPNAFLRIDSTGMVTFINNRSEMGQGVHTALAMLIAEELECDLAAVRIEAAPVAPEYNSPGMPIQITGGSFSVRSEWDRLSQAGAVARHLLIDAAADIWNVKPASCRAESGKVLRADGISLSYGELAGAAAKRPVPKEVKTKDPKDWKLLGKAYPRLEGAAKINGTAQFGVDIQLPGLVTVVVSRPPVFGAKVVSFQADKARAVPGVEAVMQISTGVAVVADGFHAASAGADAVAITWDEGAGGKRASSDLRKQLAELATKPGLIARKTGDPAGTLKMAAKTLNAEYDLPYLAHAALEPLHCVVDLKADQCDIWIGTQAQTDVRDTAARVSGLRPERIRVHTPFLGGGFGRKASFGCPQVVEALEVAKVVKKPVKVLWTREQDMKGGYYRPMWHDRLTAGLDALGNPVAWQHTIVGQSVGTGTPFEAFMVKNGVDNTSVEGAADIPYAIPHIQVDLHSPKVEIPVFFWRSVGHSHTAFVTECFLDEVAHAAGRDPLELRRVLLAGKPRHLAILEAMAKNSGWGTPLPAGRGRGLALHESFGSIVGEVAEVSVSPRGEIRVHRVVCVIDCGRTVNPDTIAAQMESGIVFGLSAAIYGEITLKNGRVEQSTYADYPILRMSEMPSVEVHIMANQEKPGGVGEPGVPPIAPAVANAVFSATGARLRSLPLTPEKVLAK